jgi:hypothetical protein
MHVEENRISLFHQVRLRREETINVLAQVIQNGFEDHQRTRGSDDCQRLTGEQRIGDTAYCARQQRFHCSLFRMENTQVLGIG